MSLSLAASARALPDRGRSGLAWSTPDGFDRPVTRSEQLAKSSCRNELGMEACSRRSARTSGVFVGTTQIGHWLQVSPCRVLKKALTIKCFGTLACGIGQADR